MNTNSDYVSPCKHTNHLFRDPLCKDQSLSKRIANIAFHIITLGIPLEIYTIHKCLFPKKDFVQNHVFPNITMSSFQNIDPSTWSVEEKKKIIINLPLWFVNHFPEPDRQTLLTSFYKDWVFDVKGKSDSKVNEFFFKQQELINREFASCTSKTGLSLRGLTIPKNDPNLAAIVDQILHSAWKGVLLATRPHYAECNPDIITHDSRDILVSELKENEEHMTDEKRKRWKSEAKDCRVYDKLKLVASSPAFTISVSEK